MSSDEEDVDEWQSEDCEDDDCEDADVDEFKAEMGAFDRVSVPGLTGNAPKTRLEKAAQEPLEKFVQSVEAIALNIDSKNKITITNNDIQEMIEKASFLQHVEHKNPSAYILGFLATKGGTQKLVTEEGNKELYEQIIEKALPLVDIEASVFPEDVIRYSRLWLQLYSKKSRV